MKKVLNIEVLFIASFAAIVKDDAKSKKLYLETLGLPLEDNGDGYYHSEQIEGVKHFGLWPLSQAAESCFGKKPGRKTFRFPRRALNLKSKILKKRPLN